MTGIELGEPHAILGELVDVGCPESFLAVGGDFIVSQIIRHEEDDVRLYGGERDVRERHDGEWRESEEGGHLGKGFSRGGRRNAHEPPRACGIAGLVEVENPDHARCAGSGFDGFGGRLENDERSAVRAAGKVQPIV